MTHSTVQPRARRLIDSHHFVTHGELIFQAGEHARCWRILSGVVHLSRPDIDGEQFAGLARPGEIIGSETLTGAQPTLTARALVDCELARCTRLERSDYLAIVRACEQRGADALSLRVGTAEQRIQRLMRLLAQPDEGGYAHIDMPSLREMSEMTDLSRETISRHISRLGQSGQLKRRNRSHALATPHYLHPSLGASLALAA